jgi:hypothetical protein
MYPSYPPYYWPPPPYYYPGAAFVGGVIWGAAVVGISNSLWGGFGWGRNEVNINVNRYNNINVNNRISNNNNTFVHNANRRGDVPYRDSKSREQYGKKQLAGADSRQDFRGKEGRPDARDADRARAQEAMKQRGVDPSGSSRDRAQAAARDADRGGAGGRDAARGDAQARDTNRGGAGSSNANRGGAGPSNAMSGVRDAGASRANQDRGQASVQSMNRGGGGGSAAARPAAASRPSPAGGGARAGGGGGGRAGGGGRR